MGLLAKLLMTNQLKFEEGVISLKDISLSLVPSSFIGELTRYYYKEDKLYHLYMISWAWGYILVRQVKEDFNLEKPAQVYSLGMDLGAAMGLGLYKTHDYYPGRYTHFVIHHNPYQPYFKSIKEKIAIDYYISGAMAGGGVLVHEQICQNVETSCTLKGDPACDFLTGTEAELKARGLWETARGRYKLDKILPLQKMLIEKYTHNTAPDLLAQISEELSKL